MVCLSVLILAANAQDFKNLAGCSRRDGRDASAFARIARHTLEIGDASRQISKRQMVG